mmetsp:Transcript_27950/g.31076  ORF Transcript_27950/g.31076 Transcript_27950/m.31076 type:complete len:403 (-) Transcript_27950:110-1318(-)
MSLKAPNHRRAIGGSFDHANYEKNEALIKAKQEARASPSKYGHNRKGSFTNDGTLPFCQTDINTFYDINEVLGEGITSCVFFATEKKTGEKVAIKTIPGELVIAKRELRKEVVILKKLRHPHIIQLRDVYVTPTQLHIVMELAEGQELFDEICDRRAFTEEDARSVVSKILRAVDYLHKKEIAHRDIKPENILFIQNEDGTSDLKLVDFGFAKPMSDKTAAPAGTLGYKAPEVLKNEPYQLKSDMWSIGVITYILLCGFPPFLSDKADDDCDTLENSPFWALFNEETEEFRDAVIRGEFSFPSPFWDKISDRAKRFIRRLLRVNVNKRSSAADALKQGWIVRQVKKKKETVSEDSAPPPQLPRTFLNKYRTLAKTMSSKSMVLKLSAEERKAKHKRMVTNIL